MSLARISVLSALAMAGLLATASPARADEAVSCQFIEISASKTKDGGIDADLKPLEKKLGKPPFSSYNTFRRLGRDERSLAPMKAESLTLKVGSAQVLLRDVDRREGKKPRVELAVTMDDAERKRVLDTKVAVDGGDFLVLGRSLPNGDGHLLAMSCKL